jgi:hypothetical protein
MVTQPTPEEQPKQVQEVQPLIEQIEANQSP